MSSWLATLLAGALAASALAQPYGGGGPIASGGPAAEDSEAVPVYPRQVDMAGAQAPSVPPGAPASSPFPRRPDAGQPAQAAPAPDASAQTIYSGPAPAGRVEEPPREASAPAAMEGGGAEPRAGSSEEPAMQPKPRPKRRVVRKRPRARTRKAMRRLKKPSAVAPATPGLDAFQAKPEPLPLVPLTPIRPDKL